METTFDFEDGNGPVPAHRHINPDDSIGGWVAETAFVDESSTISELAKVYGTASIHYSSIGSCSKIFGKTRLESCHVRGYCSIHGDTVLHNAFLIEWETPVEISNNNQYAYGHLGSFEWTAIVKKGFIEFRFGCSSHKIDFWEKHFDDILAVDSNEREPYRERVLKLIELIKVSIIP